MLTPSNQLIGPKSETSKRSASSLRIRWFAVSKESAMTVKSSVAAATMMKEFSSILKKTASSTAEIEYPCSAAHIVNHSIKKAKTAMHLPL